MWWSGPDGREGGGQLVHKAPINWPTGGQLVDGGMGQLVGPPRCLNPGLGVRINMSQGGRQVFFSYYRSLSQLVRPRGTIASTHRLLIDIIRTFY